MMLLSLTVAQATTAVMQQSPYEFSVGSQAPVPAYFKQFMDSQENQTLPPVKQFQKDAQEIVKHSSDPKLAQSFYDLFNTFLSKQDSEQLQKNDKFLEEKKEAAKKVVNVESDYEHGEDLLNKIHFASNAVVSELLKNYPQITAGLTPEKAKERIDLITSKISELLSTDFSKVRNKKTFLEALNCLCKNLDSFLFHEFGIDLDGKVLVAFKKQIKAFIHVLIGTGDFAEVQKQLLENFITPLNKKIEEITKALKDAESKKDEALVKTLNATLQDLQSKLKAIQNTSKLYTQLQNFKKFVGTPKQIAALSQKLGIKIQGFTPVALKEMQDKRAANVAAAKLVLGQFEEMDTKIPEYINAITKESGRLQEEINDLENLIHNKFSDLKSDSYVYEGLVLDLSKNKITAQEALALINNFHDNIETHDQNSKKITLKEFCQNLKNIEIITKEKGDESDFKKAFLQLLVQRDQETQYDYQFSIRKNKQQISDFSKNIIELNTKQSDLRKLLLTPTKA